MNKGSHMAHGQDLSPQGRPQVLWVGSVLVCFNRREPWDQLLAWHRPPCSGWRHGDGRHRPRRRDLRQAVHPSLGQADLRKEASHDLWGASLALFVVALVREKE